MIENKIGRFVFGCTTPALYGYLNLYDLATGQNRPDNLSNLAGKQEMLMAVVLTPLDIYLNLKVVSDIVSMFNADIINSSDMMSPAIKTTAIAIALTLGYFANRR